VPELRKCVCGKGYWFPGETWQHRGCASNATASNRSASNNVTRKDVGQDSFVPVASEVPGKREGLSREVGGGNSPKQRWSRESYNAYPTRPDAKAPGGGSCMT